MEEDNDFDEQIKKTLHLIAGRRKEKKITQTEMGRVLGLTLNSYRKIELGTSQMKMKTLLQLSKSLDLNFFKEDFLTESIVSDRLEMKEIIVNNEIKYAKTINELEAKIEQLKSGFVAEIGIEEYLKEEGKKWEDSDENEAVFYKDSKGNKARYVNVLEDKKNPNGYIGYTKEEYKVEQNRKAESRFQNRKSKVVSYVKEAFSKNRGNPLSEQFVIKLIKDAISTYFPKTLTQKEIESLILWENHKDSF